MDQEYAGICQICLRIDRKVHKVMNYNLTMFYREICENPNDKSFDPDVQCCIECETMLIKMCKFKHKCVQANIILTNWRKSKRIEPLHSIHKQLPSSSLGLWDPEQNSKIFLYQEDSDSATNKQEQETDLTTPTTQSPNETTTDNVTPCKSISKKVSLLKLKPNIQKCRVTNNGRLSKILPKPTDQDESNNNVLATEVGLSQSESTVVFVPQEAVVPTAYHIINTPQSTVNSIVLDTAENVTSETSGPVLCLQDIFASLTAGNKKNNLLDDDDTRNHLIRKNDHINDTNILDHDYCEVEKSITQPGNEGSTDQSPVLKESADQNSSKQNNQAFQSNNISQRRQKRKMEGNERKSPWSVKFKRAMEKVPVSKERLKTMLKAKFDSCDELKAHNGTVIDKDYILSLVDDKISESRQKILWGQLAGENTGYRSLVTHLAMIQKRSKNDQYESVFDIEYLNTEEEVLLEFQNRKTYKCYVDAAYKCQICYQVFKYEKELPTHQKCHNASAGSVLCDICSRRFTTKSKMTAHRHLHEMVFKCKLCPLVTMYREVMINHYNQHNGKQYICQYCVSVFKSRSAYTKHVTSACRAAPHVCTICGRAFVKESLLTAHKIRHHKDEPSLDPECAWPCTNCHLMFQTENALHRHCYTTHGERRWLMGKNKSNPRGTKRKTLEEKAANGTLPTCRLCAEVFENKYWLKTHFTAHHPLVDMEMLYADANKYLCHLCGKSFKFSSYLKTHMDKHEGKRPFPCPECPKRFQHPRVLAYHMLYHRPPEHDCHICGKMFKTKINLLIHVRTHTNIRRYKCHICGKAFLNSSGLSEHIRGVHQKIRRVKKKPSAQEKKKPMVLLYSDNESDGNICTEVSGQEVHRLLY